MSTPRTWMLLAASIAVFSAAVIVTAQEAPKSPAPRPAGTSPASSALLPQDLKIDPTITCIGLVWNIDGDSNANATGTVEFREVGQEQWNKAFDLRRVTRKSSSSSDYSSRRSRRRSSTQTSSASATAASAPAAVASAPAAAPEEAAKPVSSSGYIAGSIFGLKPGTKYELKITLADPDGGGVTKTVVAATRREPAVPKTGNIIEVTGGGAALKKALETAKAGDIFNVHAGTYEGGCVVSASGTEEQPICIRSAGDGEVLMLGGQGPKSDVWIGGDKSKINGFNVSGSYVYIEGLTFYNFHHCVWGNGAANLAVMRCKMNHFFNGIFASGPKGYYADNVIRESYNALDQTVVPGQRNEGSGIWITHGGDFSVICYNEISLVADAVRTYCAGCDVYGNDAIFCVDDAVELDGGGPNLKVMDNRWSFTGQNGLSFQPYTGGPAYLIRNLVIGPKENSIKNRYNSDGGIFVNNTLISFETQANDILLGTFSRNNLFLELPGKGKPSARIDTSPENLKRLDMDYDGFGDSGPNGMKVAEFSAKTGLEKHGVQFASNAEVLANPPGMFQEYNSKQWVVAEAFLKEKGRPHPDLSLKAGSAAIGAGVAIPNITKSAPGRAPDLGALIFGQPMPHYGPRTDKK